ncbi:hypothetical protein DSUL_160072 [Desulfovibrionales bacterium]
MSKDTTPFLVQLQKHIEKLSYQTKRNLLINPNNRCIFKHALEVELAQAQYQTYHVGLAVINLNGFKKINERYNYPYGDYVFVRLA